MKNTELIKLAEALGKNQSVTHWAISVRLIGKGDFFHRLMLGGDIRTATFNKVLQKFSDNWPSDLEWPSDIPRPAVQGNFNKEKGMV